MKNKTGSPAESRYPHAYRKDRRPVMVASAAAVGWGSPAGSRPRSAPGTSRSASRPGSRRTGSSPRPGRSSSRSTAAAAVRTWRATPDPAGRRGLLAAFATNGALNIAWSVLFFRLRRPDWALAEVVALWLSILGLIVSCGRRSRLAGWMLSPYLAWVTFASALNLKIVQLNRPFGR